MNRTCYHGGHPATGKRGSNAHHHMIDLNIDGTGAASPPPGKFSLGRVVATPGALAAVPNDEMQRALSRHHHGDWGDVCEDDRAENERSLSNGSRLFSVYHTKAGVKFYIITEAGREVTTALLPEEY